MKTNYAVITKICGDLLIFCRMKSNGRSDRHRNPKINNDRNDIKLYIAKKIQKGNNENDQLQSIEISERQIEVPQLKGTLPMKIYKKNLKNGKENETVEKRNSGIHSNRAVDFSSAAPLFFIY